MKKLIYAVLIALIVSGCTQGSDPATGEVTVKGNIKNEALVWQNYIPKVFKEAVAVPVISTRSTLTINNPERLNDISIATGIKVEADVVNSTPVPVSGFKVDIFVEHENFLTKESWACEVCYPITGGSVCEALYTVKGNRLFETNPAPVLPTCDVNTGTPDLCVTQFNNDPDCTSPTYTVSYTEAGDGLWKATLNNLTIEALTNLVNSVGMQDGGMLVGTDKYARYVLYNNFGVEVVKKDYVFNVID